MIVKFIKWLAGFFQDKDGNASRKAAGLYVGLFFMYLQIQAAVNGTLNSDQINREVFWGTLVFLLFCIGAITTEVVGKVFDAKFSKEKTNE